MRFVSLFAGVGGFDLGFERAGMECVGQVEIDKQARGVLDRQWPDVPKHDDVTTAIGWADERGLVGNVDLVCGGFPCQDVSVAGKRAGLAGKRTGLFWDALAFSENIKAKWVVLENVPGLFTSNQGRDFGVILTALHDSGYPHIEWRVMDSQFYGVAQRRRRVFIVASSTKSGGRAVFVEPESLPRNFAKSIQPGKNSSNATSESIGGHSRGFTPGGFGNYREGIGTLRANGGDLGGGSEVLVLAHAFYSTDGSHGVNMQPEISPPLKVGSGLGISSPPAFAKGPVVRKLTPIECERLQGFPDDWTAGQADSHRYKQMGNAVTVNVAEYVGRLIMEATHVGS